jgi:hypothetical protein
LICSKFEIMGGFLEISRNTAAIIQTNSIIELSLCISLICSKFVRMDYFLEINSDDFDLHRRSNGNMRVQQSRRSIRYRRY